MKYSQAHKQEIVKRWKSVRPNDSLLGGVDEDQQESFAAALEGQRIYNETCNDIHDIAKFKRLSIPMMRRLMYGAPNLEGSFEQCRYWHLMTTRFAAPRQRCDMQYNLEKETEYTVKLVLEMAEEIKLLGPTKIFCFAKYGEDRLLLNCENA